MDTVLLSKDEAQFGTSSAQGLVKCVIPGTKGLKVFICGKE